MNLSRALGRFAVYSVATILIGGFGILAWKSPCARDFYGFWVVGQGIKTLKVTNIYSDDDRQRIGEYFLEKAAQPGTSPGQFNAARLRRLITPAGTPYLFSVFSLLSTGRYEVDYERFRVLSLIVYLLSILWLCLKLKVPVLLTMVWLVSFTFFFKPFIRDVLEGNVNQLQIGALTLILFLRSMNKGRWRDIAAGILLGLLIVFKPNLATILVFVALGGLLFGPGKRLLDLAVGAGVGTIMGVALPALVLGRACGWRQWLESSPKMVFTKDYVMQSFLGMISRVSNIYPFYFLMSFLILCPVLLIVAAKTKIKNRSASRVAAGSGGTREDAFAIDCLMVGLGVCVYLLSSPLVHFHYFALLVPLLLFVLRPKEGTYAGFNEKDLLGLLTGILAFVLLNIITNHEGYPGQGILFTYCPLAYLATLLLYALGVTQLLSRTDRGSLPPGQASLARK